MCDRNDDVMRLAVEFRIQFLGMLELARLDSRLKKPLEAQLAEHDFCCWVKRKDPNAFGLTELPLDKLVRLCWSIADAWDYMTNFNDEWPNPVVKKAEAARIRAVATKLEGLLSQYDLNFSRQRELILLLREMIDLPKLGYTTDGGVNRKVPRQVAIKKLYSNLESLFPDWPHSKLVKLILAYFEDVSEYLAEKQVNEATRFLGDSGYAYSIKKHYGELKRVDPGISVDDAVETIFVRISRKEMYEDIMARASELPPDLELADVLRLPLIPTENVTREEIRAFIACD